MRLFLYVLCAVSLIVSCETDVSKKRIQFVIDHENLLTAEEEKCLDSICLRHEELTGNEIVIFTSATMDDSDSALAYATLVGNRLGIGKKERENGVVLFVSRTCKQMAIAVGKGTESVLRNEITDDLVDTLLIPHFRQGHFFKGLYQGTVAITAFLEQPEHSIE